jgi:hypothetical protein
VQCSAKRICTRYKPVLCRPIQWVRHLQQPSGTQDQGTCQNSTFPSKPRNQMKIKFFVELEKSISSCGILGSNSDTNSWVKPTGKVGIQRQVKFTPEACCFFLEKKRLGLRTTCFLQHRYRVHSETNTMIKHSNRQTQWSPETKTRVMMMQF